MRNAFVTTAAAALIAAAGLLVVRVEPPAGFLLGGIQVNEPDHGAWFDALREERFNTVSATVYAKQGDWDSDHLWWEDDEPHVLAEIRGAKRAGLRVVLIPRVALDHAYPRNLFLWHGMIVPRDETTLEAWFTRYREFVVRWAKVAQRENVDLFAIGSELSALTSTRPPGERPALASWYLDADAQRRRRDEMLRRREEIATRNLWIRGREEFASLEDRLDAEIEAHRSWAAQTTFAGEPDAVTRIDRRAERLDRAWRDLIDAVRAVYSGPLTYAANFDQYAEVGFWDALDRMGINAYWSLRDGVAQVAPEVLPDVLRAGWSRVLDEIDRERIRIGRPALPVVFTEIGYTQRRNGTVQPWAGEGFWLRLDEDRPPELFVWGDEPRDLDERAVAVRALAAALADRRGPPLLDGVLWWKLSTVPDHRGIEPFVAILGDRADRALFEALREVRRSSLRPGTPATTAGLAWPR